MTTWRVDGAVVVAPRGDLDLMASPALRTMVHRLIDDGAEAVVLDLSDVGFVDSTALSALVSFHRRLGERLVLAAAGPQVRRLLEITMLATVLHVTDSVATALTAVRT
jgi:anti-sigma B factor antagonist